MERGKRETKIIFIYTLYSGSTYNIFIVREKERNNEEKKLTVKELEEKNEQKKKKKFNAAS